MENTKELDYFTDDIFPDLPDSIYDDLAFQYDIYNELDEKFSK